MTIPRQAEKLRAHIEEIRKNSPLAARHVTLLAASKGQGAGAITDAIRAGITDFGENRVQEAAEKWPHLRSPAVRLHLIGPLQSNKAKEALALFDVIQTLDRPKLAQEIVRIRDSGFGIQGKQFYIQVNTGKEARKAGVMPEEADGFIDACLTQWRLPVVGLMCIPPSDQPPAPHFACLREMARRHGLNELSMGMSDDFPTAIRMGSSCVRLGRALFGERV